MAYVTLEAEAAEQYGRLPERIKSRVTGIIERLGGWPEVSGARPLRGKLAGRRSAGPGRCGASWPAGSESARETTAFSSASGAKR